MSGCAVWTCVVWLAAAWVGCSAAVGGADDPPLDEEYPGLALDYPEVLDYPQGTDYLYHDGEYTVFTPYLPNVTLHKCRCGGDEVWDGQACQKTPTYVAILEPYSGQRVAANTSALGEVTVAPLTCPPDLHLVMLDSNKYHEFSLLESGDLYWEHQVFPSYLYCVDHTLDTMGEPTSWSAEVCLSPPPLPRCCPDSHILTRDGTCVASPTTPALTPPVQVLEEVLVWHNETEGPVLPVTCEDTGGDSEMHQVEIGDDAALVWDYHGPVLRWTPPSVLSLPEHRLDYCLGVLEEGTIVARVCYKDPVAEHRRLCRDDTCVRKCCPLNHLFTGTTCTRVANESEEWRPRFHQRSGSEVTVSPPTDLTIITGLPLCTSYFRMETHERYYLLPDGSLYITSFSRKFLPDSYCLENFQTEVGVHALPLVCFVDDHCKTVQERMYPILLAISCVFLAITLLVYVTVPELHAKVHGKCLVSHVTALLLAYLGLIIIQRTAGKLPDVWCKIMASITHVSFLATFFWLNVMCFDIWWTLKSMRPVAETGERSRLRFKMYSVYSWGCPALITMAAVIIQLLPEHYDVIRPDFGVTKCWFDNKKSTWAYFYGFVLVLVVCNIVFFCWVAFILIMAQNDPILQRTRQQNRERMWLYVKLFLVMGLTWITEVISWQEGSCQAWIATDVVNALQGFSIFLIFICKKNMIKRIRSNWDPYLRRVKELFGPSLPPPSTRKAVRDTSSFSSSSVNRPSQSNASQRTVQSQISVDPNTASRKLSTTSYGSLVGMPLHPSNSLPMTTITEATHHEGPDDPESEHGTGEENEPNERQGQEAQAPGKVQIYLEKEEEEDEEAQRQNHQQRSDLPPMQDLPSVHEVNHAGDSMVHRPPRKPKDAAALIPNGHASLDMVTNTCSDPPNQSEHLRTERRSGEVTVNPQNCDPVEPHINSHNPSLGTQTEKDLPLQMTEKGTVTARDEKDSIHDWDAQEGIFNRSFTTEHDDDQPVEL